MNYLQAFKDILRHRNLTEHTLTSYCTYIVPYLDYVSAVLSKTPEDVSYPEISQFIDYIQDERDLSDRSVNFIISQIRCFNIYVLHKPWDDFQIPRRKFDTYLPYVPNQQTVRTFIVSIDDLKIKAMVALLYSAGLRHCEVRNLKYEDISRQDRRIHVTHSKNRSDRYAVLSSKALDILTQYWYAYNRPKGWLFPKQRNQDKQIDHFFLPRQIRNYEKKLGWEHKLSCHTFRHAFGTHLYENGADLLTIKAYMGHKSLDSTAIYVQLAVTSTSKTPSPFDVR